MIKSRLTHSFFLMFLTGVVGVTASADSIARITPDLAPGSLVMIDTAAGPVGEVILSAEGTRALVWRFGEAHWESTRALASGARIYAPVANPYTSVLVPVYAEGGRVVLGFDVFAVTSLVKDEAGRQIAIAGNGRGYAIGVHGETLRENIPLKAGQTIPEAIRDFNVGARALGLDRVMNENARLDRSREFEVIDLARARAQADAEALTQTPGDRRAERAVRAERGAGERARLRDAILKAREVR